MSRSPLAIMARLIVYVGPLVPVMIASIVLGILGYLAAIGITVLGGIALLRALGIAVYGGTDLPAVLTAIAACAVLRGMLRYGEQMSGHYIAFKLLAVLRDKVFQALRRLAPAKLEGRSKGNLISVVTSDIELLEVFYAHTIGPVFIGAITSLLLVWFIASYSALLALIAAVAYVTVGVIIPMVTTRIGKHQGAVYRTRFGLLNGYLLDSLRGMRECIQFGCGEQRHAAIKRMTDALDDAQRKLKRHEAAIRALTEAALLLFSFAVLLVGVKLMNDGRIGFEGVVVPFIAMLSSFGPVTALGGLANSLLQTFASGERLLRILEEPAQTADVEEGAVPSFTGASCEQVRFSYEAERILDDVNVTLPANRIIGIAGRSGSGKSTLLRLLMRFWDVSAGRVAISGHDIREVNTHHLRSLQGYMTQDTFLLDGTIEDNIRIGHPQATFEQIVEAAQQASIHSFISTLPQGYRTAVGELGDKLSSGERQRLGLARAFLHQAPLLLLDEPTSNLDGLNEAIILKSLGEQRSGKTIVLVSHRESALRIADQIHRMAGSRLS